MPVWIKTPDDIEAIRAAGNVLVSALASAARLAVAGTTTRNVDAAFEQSIGSAGAVPILKGMQFPSTPPFPASCCVCINDEIVHAIPGSREIRDGDLVTIDGAVQFRGWCADAAVSLCVGAHPRAERLARACRECLRDALASARPGVTWSSVAGSMHRAAAIHGACLVPGFDGHGIGRSMHEPPRCWLTGGPSDTCPDFDLRPGMVLTLEPVIAETAVEGRVLRDGWTMVTADGSWSCHEEITIAITSLGADVLTRTASLP